VDVSDRVMAREWFYRFSLPDGQTTPSYASDDIAQLHATRVRMLDSVVDPLLEGTWQNVSSLDIACHEGYFATHMAQKGCRDVVGVDVRPEHVENAQLIGEALGLDRLRFEAHDVLALAPGQLGQFDVVLAFGLLYHLQDPLGALRVARSHTRKVCIIETQVAPDLPGVIEWGSSRNKKQISGNFALIDEGEEVTTGNREASVLNLSLVPSPEAIAYSMRALGFQRIEQVPAAPGDHEQLQSGHRIVIAGYL
jgi:tRNA (mo5U34)-methyltransferase